MPLDRSEIRKRNTSVRMCARADAGTLTMISITYEKLLSFSTYTKVGRNRTLAWPDGNQGHRVLADIRTLTHRRTLWWRYPTRYVYVIKRFAVLDGTVEVGPAPDKHQSHISWDQWHHDRTGHSTVVVYLRLIPVLCRLLFTRQTPFQWKQSDSGCVLQKFPACMSLWLG